MGCSASSPRPAPNSESFSSPSPSGSARSSPAAVGRALSLPTPLVHHPPVKKGDTHHLVSLTSTTYGSLQQLLIIEPKPSINSHLHEKQPIISLSPVSVINTWELMDGLDSDSDQIPPENTSTPTRPTSTPPILTPIPSTPTSIPAKPTSEIMFEGFVVNNPIRSTLIPAKPTSEIMFEGFVVNNPIRPSSIKADLSPIRSRPTSIPEKPSSNPAKPTSENVFDALFEKDPTRPGSIPAKMEEEIGSIPPWSPTKPLWKHISEESLLAKLDPNVASTYTRALSSQKLTSDQPYTRRSSSFSNHRPSKNRAAIVIYFTSLRGIRKTYEDCCLVRTILGGYRVWVDEKDISMDSLLRKELQGRLGGAARRLPQVFIGGKHVGGAEEIREMNESGELAGMLEEFPAAAAEMRSVCGRCGDARFVPCPNCNGSRKLFREDDGIGMMRCPNCNENGLIRCPFCCCF